MMKRALGLALVVGIVGAMCLVTGCASAGRHVDVYITCKPGETEHKVVGISGYPTVLQVMKQVARLDTQMDPNGDIWIIGIDGKKDDVARQKFWMYQVNNLLPIQAPNVQMLKPGDRVEWWLK